MDKNDLIHALGAALASDPDIAGEAWEQLILVGQFKPGSISLNGFLYDASGRATPAAPSDFTAHDHLESLREVMAKGGEDRWRACLIRIDRSSGKISVDFEYDAPEKWEITPANVKDMAERLRA